MYVYGMFAHSCFQLYITSYVPIYTGCNMLLKYRLSSYMDYFLGSWVLQLREILSFDVRVKGLSYLLNKMSRYLYFVIYNFVNLRVHYCVDVNGPI